MRQQPKIYIVEKPAENKTSLPGQLAIWSAGLARNLNGGHEFESPAQTLTRCFDNIKDL